MKQQPKADPNPLARREGLVIRELADEVLVYDLDRDRAHCLNQTAAFVWQCCDGRTSTGEIARALGKRVSAPVDEKLVWLALDQLADNDLLKRRLVTPPPLAGINRRQMVRTLGLAAVVAVPLVTSIVAPTAVQAATCLATGNACASGLQCCSALCNSNVCV
jgi:hypothetical protein